MGPNTDTDPGDGNRADDPGRPLTTSELLLETIQKLDNSHIEVGELMLQFQRRSFGGVLLILAILAMVPGISVFAGIAMLVPAYQLMVGLAAPVFPKRIQTRKISVVALRKWGYRIIYWVETLERMIKLRWPLLTGLVARRVLGFVIFLLALVIVIPFPFSNFPPSVAVTCFALGLLERDGVMITIGAAISVVAFTIGITVFYLVGDWVMRLFT